MSDQGPINIQAQRDRNRGWNVKKRRKVAARDLHIIPGDSASSEANGQNSISTPPLTYVMKHVVPPLLALLALKYQGKTESLFLENPAPAWCFLAATFVYGLIVTVMKQMPTLLNGICFQIANRAALASGVLSAVSLVSAFFPYPLSLVPLIFWTPLPLVLAWPNACALLHTGIRSVTNKIHAIIDQARGRNLMEKASLPM